MNELPLHPKLVHLPMALAVLMPLLASGVLVAVARGCFARRVWVLVVAAQALLFASGLLAMRSGEGDEDRVERVVPESAIETHEDAAGPFVWASGAVLLLLCLPLLLRNPGLGRITGIGACAGTLVVLALGWRVGQSGGELVWRHGAATAYAMAGPAGLPAPKPERERDDDR
ncbi:MAG: hypothetical protein IT457_16230 [Planctomycetes bacterium]|nr:hypothetical protein [Planctomycetota bacterium]